MRAKLLAAILVACAAAGGRPAAAEEPPPDEARIEEARAAFRDGADAVGRSEWSDALVAFEKSYALRPHAVTTFNVGVALRALGQCTRARRAFDRALAEHASRVGTLPEDLIEQTRAFRDEIDRVLGHLTVEIDPAAADVAVDGRPLEAEKGGDVPIVVAGVRPPGPGESAPAKRFEILLDPGPHVLVIARKGFADALVRKSFAPGARESLPLKLDELPASLRVTASERGALVHVDGVDVGPAPIDVKRPAGEYTVRVTKKDWVAYETRVRLAAGGEIDVRAPLKKREPALTERWWFWSAIGVAVTGAAVGTYFGARPDPQRPPLDGGALGWTVRVQ